MYDKDFHLTCHVLLHWLPVHDRIEFKIATMTHRGIYTGNPPYLANLVQWHTPSRNLRSASANILSVIRCNISFGARGFRSAAPAIWNSLPSNVHSCEVKLSQHSADTWNLIVSIQPLPLPSDPSQCLWFVHDHGTSSIYLLRCEIWKSRKMLLILAAATTKCWHWHVIGTLWALDLTFNSDRLSQDFWH